MVTGHQYKFWIFAFIIPHEYLIFLLPYLFQHWKFHKEEKSVEVHKNIEKAIMVQLVVERKC